MSNRDGAVQGGILVRQNPAKVQLALRPDAQEDRVVAVDRETGNFALGNDYGEAFREFRKKYPDAWPYISKVDGSPALRM